MQKIPLHLASEGMVLARDVSRNDSSSNIPVCGKDTVLTNELIRRFDLMDIKTVYVQGRPVVIAGEPTLDAMLAELDHRFKKVRNDPLTSKVYDIYTAYIKRTMGD
jgi:hypothetical protein